MTGFDDVQVLGFDLETTGVSTDDDRIVTACAVLVEGGRVVHERNWLVAVDVDIPEGATAVHGITTDHAREHGVAADVAVKDIAGAIRYAVRSARPVVGFNVSFDLSMLDAECRRHGLGTLEEFCGRPVRPVLDGYVLDKATDRYRPGKRTLGTVCEHLGIELADAHNATADAVAAVEVVRRLLARARLGTNELMALYAGRKFPDGLVRSLRALGSLGAEDLHDRQIQWYAEQSKSLGEYWQREANEKRAQAGRGLPPGDADLGPDERRQVLLDEAAELEQRIASLRFEWPIAVSV
ncbi:exonuclease domain-containing protein [Dactylosporangium sucinum]|uniref:3'-5' exonuclease n=1 Tax=Dactylosporangium sucinum TaxID=1424081 RepID=A0A917X0E0_9ACTN|nr:exonuclease domain-containing protein [Dactylosporangium sucinum]GGM53781.1 3'-5' exonuclease [Dactylosporangium sucinum]